MTAVYCFSGTGHSLAVARYFADRLHTRILELDQPAVCDTAVVVFPVYCENLPDPVRTFLPRLAAENLVLIATYGKMWHGNVLADAGKLVRGRVIAGAYVPIGHSYLTDDPSFDPAGLEPILDRITDPRPAAIPTFRKHIWADLFPAWRSRMGVRIIRNGDCTGCGLCRTRCPVGAIKNRCIRCLRCVRVCPQQALSFRLHPLMRFYLSRQREDRLKIFL